MFERIKRGLSGAGFFKNVGILVGGTVVAQLVTFALLPLITRIYLPDDFANFAIFFSIVTLFVPIMCLRLELLIPIVKDEQEAFYLAAISLLSCVVLAVLIGISISVYGNHLAGLFNKADISQFLWLIPIGLLSEGLYSTLQFWAARKKYFSLLAKSKIAQTSGEGVIQVSAGALGYTSFGLMLGYIGKILFGSASICRSFFDVEKARFQKFSVRDAKNVYLKHRRASSYSVLDALLNSSGSQIPILIIASLVAGPEVGFLMLAMKVSAVPMGLLGRNISHVYLAEAPTHHATGELGPFTTEILSKLILLGAPLIILSGAASPILFPIVFGDEWKRAGEILLWMTPWYVMSFLAVPVSMSLQVTNNQQKAFYMQALGGVIRIGAIGLGLMTPQNSVIEAYAVSGFVFYLLYLVVIIKVTGVEMLNILRVAKTGLLVCLASVFFGSLIVLIG